MIDHITISVRDAETSKRFYEKAFLPLGYNVSFGEDGVFWAFDVGDGALFEFSSYKKEKSPSSVHVAFRIDSDEKVRQFYQAALKAGAKDNGPPGPRPEYGEKYYACFVLDPDGHNIEAMFDTQNC